MTRKTMWAIMLALLYLAFELSAFLGLLFLEKQKDIFYNPILKTSVSGLHRRMLEIYLSNEAYVVHDSETGWALNPNFQNDLYQINNQGLRAKREYAPAPDSGITRISVYGDSFTFGDEVENDQTWAVQLEGLNEQFEVINFGVSGYGIDQAFLRYKALGRNFHSDIVLICVMPADIRRHVNVFRPFLHSFTGLPLSKPRFLLEGDSLRLILNPLPEIDDYKKMLANPEKLVPELGRYDDFFRRGYDKKAWDRIPSFRLVKTLLNAYKRVDPGDQIIVGDFLNETATAFLLTKRILSAFRTEALARGETPVFVLLPARKDIAKFRKRGLRIYAPLIAFLQKNGMMYVDIMEGFEKYGGNEKLNSIFLKSHYSPSGNHIVARTLSRLIPPL